MKVSSLDKRISRIKEKASIKGWSQEKTERKIGDNNERLDILNNTLQTMKIMEMDQNEVYHLDKSNVEQLVEGNVRREGNQIHIYYHNTPIFVHEITHAGQGYTGDLKFLPNGLTLYQDIYDEVDAYKAQYAYQNLPLYRVTPSMIQNIDFNGERPYAPTGMYNIGIIPVNNRSDLNTKMKAYPWNF